MLNRAIFILSISLSLSLCLPAGYSKDVDSKTSRRRRALKDDRQAVREVVKAVSRLDLGNLSPCPDAFEYFPHSGPQQVACYLLSLTSVRRAMNTLSMPIFKSGPHTVSGGQVKLKLDHPYDFGHYNLTFVQWLKDMVVPVLTRPIIVKAVQEKYNQTLRSFMSTLSATLTKIDADPDCFEAQVKEYRSFLTAHQSGTFRASEHPDLPYERYYYFMNRDFCSHPNGSFEFFSERGHAGYAGGEHADGNMVKGCVSWWIRRTIDGSAPLFKEIVREVVKAYHPPVDTTQTVTVSDDEDQVLETLQRFKALIKSKSNQRLLEIMHPLYIERYHDKRYEGDTRRFLEQFFCGEAVTTGKSECLDPSRVTTLDFQYLKRGRGVKTWYVQYLMSGYTMNSDELTMIKFNLLLARREVSPDSYQYRLVGHQK